MLKNSSDIVLYRIEHTRNMQRFYTISVEPNLFGGGSLIRTWGRIGTRGQTKIELFDDELLAQFECERLRVSKQKRGYQYRS